MVQKNCTISPEKLVRKNCTISPEKLVRKNCTSSPEKLVRKNCTCYVRKMYSRLCVGARVFIAETWAVRNKSLEETKSQIWEGSKNPRKSAGVQARRC